jgi:hypothetical protein
VRYGGGLAFARITRLTPDDYCEEVIEHVGADRLSWRPRAEGIHTWNAGGRFCVVDFNVSRFRWRRWLGG